jgi:hypothetical protein
LEEAVTDPNNAAAATGSSLDSTYFTDGDQLTAMLVDKRAADTKQRSSFDDAQAIVSAFAAETNPGAWSATLSRADVANRLTQMVTVPDPTLKDPASSSGPRSLQQGALNLCGPTAFFQMALGRDPVAVMRFATQLFDNGSATLGNLKVSPGQDLLQADFSAMIQKGGNTFTAAEWMLFGALRNSTDVFWQGSWQGDPDQMVAAMTRPEELAGWMRDSGIWPSVDDHGKWASNPGIVNASDLKMDVGTDIPLLIHANLIAKSTLWNPNTGNPDNSGAPAANPIAPDNTFLLSSFPDHWIVLLNEIMPDVKQENVLLAVWTWGKRYFLQTPNQVFLDNYYGSITSQRADG